MERPYIQLKMDITLLLDSILYLLLIENKFIKIINFTIIYSCKGLLESFGAFLSAFINVHKAFKTLIISLMRALNLLNYLDI